MKKLIGILTFLLLSILVFGQDASPQEKNNVEVTLKNGHKLSGQLIYYIPHDKLSIRISEGNDLVLPMEEVKDLEMSQEKVVKPYSFKERKIYNRTHLSILTGESGDGYALSHSVSYQYKHWIGVGLGAGIANYYNSSGYNLFPVFAEVRSYLLQKNATPFFGLKAGYAFNNADEEIGQLTAEGGRMLNGYLGYRFSGDDMMIDIFSGIVFQKSEYESISGETLIHDKMEYKRLEMGIGIMF